MAAQAKDNSPRFHTLTPHIAVRGAAEAIAFYKKAFGAEEMLRLPMPGDPARLMHACLGIGDSHLMLADEFPGCSAGPATLGGSPVTIHLNVPDVDATMAKAVAAGAKVTMPAMDMFWGDRYGQLVDPFGHKWSVATHVRDVSPEELAKGAAEAMAAHAAQQKQSAAE
ncbi:MAG: VOC family protein [Alphaproteobacteria bacterium]|nr:VOC family protein [Alphaproteobacteria bacterium]